METEKLYVSHIQVNKAMKGRRRTNRAHGRVNPYMSSPCHVEMILKEKADGVAKGVAEEHKNPKLSRKQAARMLRTNYKPIGWKA